MDAAAHPTKPSTPPYGSPGTLQCISQLRRARRLGEMWGALDAAAKQKCADDAPMVAVKPKKPKAKRSTAPAPAAAPAPAKAAEPFDDDETLRRAPARRRRR